MTDLRTKHHIISTEFPQTVDRLTACGQCLYDLIKYHVLELYPDSAIRSHLLAAVAKTTPRGFRIVKDVKSKRIDIAIAMSMATYGLTQLYIPTKKKKKNILHYNGNPTQIWVEPLVSDSNDSKPFNSDQILTVIKE